VSKIHVDFVRGKRVESAHKVKALVTTVDGKILLSTNNDIIFSEVPNLEYIDFEMSFLVMFFELFFIEV